ncbi:hypothetical protein CMV30_06315 [Nibricoccus aquaticus]|uniref:DUF2007 domain-containing protein n=1 Tax=Nibricoccus aquaticus TaxID=2576891 RepID=A0A290QE34_9BACT|nr:DUF2007 domain-containing protein [Nibricoccus aquaticus]ATC63598.1 hypothetical protein CMV30_06315 [Nibricoccus aquaticus]
MKTVLTCNNPAEAAVVSSILEAEGIETFVPQENTPQPIAGFPGGFQVKVQDEQFERALEILRAGGFAPTALLESSLSPRISHPKLPLFRWLLITHVILAIGIWFNAQKVDTRIPYQVRDYLDSLAPSLELWGLGYLGWMIGFGIDLVGSVILFFRSRFGLWVFAGGLALQTLWLWVFPGGIVYGAWSMIGTIDITLAGFLFGWAWSDKALLFSEKLEAKPSE